MSDQNKKQVKKQYFVRGMHCSSCETLIKREIAGLSGISKVDVSAAESLVKVYASSEAEIPGKDLLNEKLKDLGYSFYESRPKSKPLRMGDVLKTAAAALFFITLFYVLERSGYFMRFSLTSQSSMLSYFVFGLAAGLSSCAALVGGLLLSLSKNWNELYNNNSRKNFIPFAYFNISRILAFTFLGGLLGLAGSYLTLSVTASSLLTICIALLMLFLGLQMIGIKWLQKFSLNPLRQNKYLIKTDTLRGKYVPLIVGALTFFIPCGFTLIAQTNTLAAGSFLRGALQLFAFSLGTLPILALVSFSSIKLYSNPNFSKKFSLFSGIIIIFFALYTFNSQLNVLGYSSLSDIKVGSRNAEIKGKAQEKTDYQVMQMEAVGFEYHPREITIQSGVKTRWEIYNSGSLGCANAVYARGLYPQIIYLKPGLNTVEFVAPQKGTYKISCSMGMVLPITVKVL